MNKAQVLEQHEFPVLVQAVQQFIPQVVFEYLGYLLDILLRYRARRLDALEVVEEVGVFEEQLLEVDLGLFDNVPLVVVVDQLAVVLGERLETLAAHEEHSNFGQLFAGRDVACFFEELLELLLPSGRGER